MTEGPENPEEGRIKAAELYAEARKLEAKRDYEGAIRSYEKSLQHYDDENVRAAYFRWKTI